MAIRQILVPLTGHREAVDTVTCALTLAQRLGAHVTVTDTTAPVGPYIDAVGMPMAPMAYDEVMKALEAARSQAQKRARHCFDAAVAATKVPIADHPPCVAASTTWAETADFVGSAISRLGCMADLIVASRPGADGIAELEVLEDAIFTVRRPVLVVPPRVTAIAGDVAVAWNGSLEAADALERALDLFAPGTRVALLQVGELAPGGVPAEEAVTYLGWHGFTATVKTLPDHPKATAQILLREAKAARAGLLVMGAYTHSRLREMVLGGVTATMLKQADLSLLMAH